jgi:hypothetical protein
MQEAAKTASGIRTSTRANVAAAIAAHLAAGNRETALKQLAIADSPVPAAAVPVHVAVVVARSAVEAAPRAAPAEAAVAAAEAAADAGDKEASCFGPDSFFSR